MTAALRAFGMVTAAVLLLSDAASSQAGFEVGIDGAITFTMPDEVERLPSTTIQTWAFPVQRIRVGGLNLGRFQPQLAMGFAVADFGEVSTVTFSLGLSGLYQLTGEGARSGLFVSAGGGFHLLSDNGTDVQWNGGVGLGARVPMGRQFAFRPALEVGRALRSERRLGGTMVSVVLGFSVFTGSDGEKS